VGAKGVAVFDGGGEAGADDGATGGGVGGTPLERVRFDPVLVRVCWEEVGVSMA
jgi:hypothetical protein